MSENCVLWVRLVSSKGTPLLDAYDVEMNGNAKVVDLKRKMQEDATRFLLQVTAWETIQIFKVVNARFRFQPIKSLSVYTKSRRIWL